MPTTRASLPQCTQASDHVRGDDDSRHRVLSLDGGGFRGFGIADYECRQILGRRYQRLNPVLDTAVALDSVESCTELERVAARADLGETIEWLDRSFGPP